MGKGRGSSGSTSGTMCAIEARDLLDQHLQGKPQLAELHRLTSDAHYYHEERKEDASGRIKDTRILGLWGDVERESAADARERHYNAVVYDMTSSCVADRHQRAEQQVATLLKDKTPAQQLSILEARVDHSDPQLQRKENSKGQLLDGQGRFFWQEATPETVSDAVERHRAVLTGQILRDRDFEANVAIPGR